MWVMANFPKVIRIQINNNWRYFHKSINQKAKIKALKMALTDKVQNEKLILFQELTKKYNQIRRTAEQENEA